MRREEEYRAFAAEILVREAMVDGQVLVTTTHNARVVPKRKLARLYARRWHIELVIRNIKTSLGLEVRRCMTPAMVEKKLWVCLLAYNPIRLLLASL